MSVAFALSSLHASAGAPGNSACAPRSHARSVCKGQMPTAEHVNQLKYAHAVVKETLRLWPVAGTARMGPSGTKVQVSAPLLVSAYVGCVCVRDFASV